MDCLYGFESVKCTTFFEDLHNIDFCVSRSLWEGSLEEFSKLYFFTFFDQNVPKIVLLRNSVGILLYYITLYISRHTWHTKKVYWRSIYLSGVHFLLKFVFQILYSTHKFKDFFETIYKLSFLFSFG